MLEEFTKKHRVKLGLAPTRRNLSKKNFFDKADANVEKELVETMLKEKQIEFVNLDFLNEEGIICQGSDADRAADYFIGEGVDAVFAPHCNFGTEDAIAKLAKKVNKPLLIWGPRDDAPTPEGDRLRDSQCGLFATSKVLQQFEVPFSYIPNTKIKDKVFQMGFDNFIAAAAVVKAFHHVRIGQIGVRPGAFWSVKCNEEELLQRFGVELVPISIPDLKNMMDQVKEKKREEIQYIKEDIRKRIQEITLNDEEMDTVASMRIAVTDWAKQEKLSAAAMLCGGAVRELLGICPCFTMSELTDAGFPVACETDIHGAITSLMVQAAVHGRSATFLADMTIRHPENDNAELLWHCGVFPESLKSERCVTKLNNHYGAGVPGAAQWEIRGGPITVARFDGISGDYRLLMAEGQGISGPVNKGTYLWAEFKNWMELETRLIKGPYIHHCSGVHGHVAAALYEACKYIPGLVPDAVFPEAIELENFLISPGIDRRWEHGSDAF